MAITSRSTPEGNSESNLIRMTDKEFDKLTGFMKQKFGIDLSKKRLLIEGRLTHELNVRGLKNYSQYIDIVFNDKQGSEVTFLLNKLTTNHSYFLRENEHFEYLFDEVLPLLEKTRSRTKDLKIWSAGCSTGQEPYNIAMVIDEYFGGRKSGWDTTILATDISMNVLGKAQEGKYSSDDLKDMSPSWKSKYFKLLPDGRYQVTEKIRKEVIFRPFNLMDPFAFKSQFDLIFCRNVMIYFDNPTKAKLVDKFYNASADGAFFFIGHSESITNQKTRYTYVKPAIYQRRG